VHWCITARRDATSDGDGAQIRAPISIGEVTMALDARSGAAPSAVAAPFVAVDHAGIARLVHAVAALWALAAAVLGVLVGLERFDAGTALVDAGAHVQLVALARIATEASTAPYAT
jgi:hypothetical protein